MSINLTFNELMEYTEWERGKWHKRLKEEGDQVLAISAGPHGDGRFQTVGDLVRHIFSAEKRYIEWLSGLPIAKMTDPASIPNNNVEALFRFGDRSRAALKEFLEKFPANEWEVERELRFPNWSARGTATPKKIVTHVLLHEIRHWAQIGTLLRLSGVVDEWHDFIFGPVMGGEWIREQQKSST